MAEEKGVFVRKASGLTRVISVWDALIYAFCNPGILYCMLYITWGPWSVGPGGDMPFAVLTVFLLLPIQALYWLFSVSMPRSGAEYLYVSRIITPAWGLFASWTMTIIGISWTGNCAVWMINYGISQLFWNQGLLTGNKSLLDIGYALSDNSIMQYGGPVETTALNWAILTVALITIFYIMARGAKASMRLSWISTGLATIGVIAFAIAALTAGESVFISRVNALWSDPVLQSTGYFAYTSYAAYHSDVVTLAGYPGGPSLIGTIFAGTAYVNLNTLGSTYTTSAAGEIKSVSKAQGLALLGSMFLFMAYWEAFYGTAYIGCGSDFWWGIGYAEQLGLDYAAFGGMASGMSIVPYLTDNLVLIHLTSIGFIGATYGSCLGMSFGPVRNMFAWSFDGVLPSWWNRVDKRGSPYVSVAAAGVIAWVFGTLYLWTNWLTINLYSITVWFIGWCVVGIAGIVYPWRRKDIFEKSPQLVKRRIAGIPVITVLGSLTLGISAFTVWVTLAPSIIYGIGVNSTGLIGSVSFLIIIPFVIYYAAYFINKRKGVPMELRFKEIPPD